MDNSISPPERKRNGRSGKPPAFQFYPADWLADEAVALMSMTEVGIYATLLAFAWREGSIPASEDDRRRLCRCQVLVMRQAWVRVGRCWEPHPELPGRLINPRQEVDRCALLERHRGWVSAGIQGGRKSAKVRSEIQASVEPRSTSASASASASAEEGGGVAGLRGKIELLPQQHPCSPAVSETFDQFWRAFPKKIGKRSALKAWSRLKPDLERVLVAIAAAKKSEAWRKDGGQFIPHPTTWLNQGRWDDELATFRRPSYFDTQGESNDQGRV